MMPQALRPTLIAAGAAALLSLSACSNEPASDLAKPGGASDAAAGAPASGDAASAAQPLAGAPDPRRDAATAAALQESAVATREALSAVQAEPAPGNALGGDTATDAGAAAGADEAVVTGDGAGSKGDPAQAEGGLAVAADLYEPQWLMTEPEGLAAAEAGQIGRPTLVWFHADWCHVCQEIEPTVEAMRGDWNDSVAFVKMDVDDAASSEALRRYAVSGTPTFVLFQSDGRPAGRFAGWPGEAAVEGYLGQLQ